MASLRVLQVVPELLDVNGDAQNALVLAQRARWSGHVAVVEPLALGAPTPARPDLVVIGSSTDAPLKALRDDLQRHRDALAGWIADGVPMLAVGTGWELLGASIDLGHETIAGLGLVEGEARAATSRITDDLVIDSPFGRLIGYENHARLMSIAADATPVGTVVHGTGGGAGSEGLLAGALVATRMHGPVLAKNPAVADHLLSLALGGNYDPGNVPATHADEMARAARKVIAARLQIEA